MSLLGFEHETLLDLIVNAIPLGIILFFVVAFLAFPAYGFDPVMTATQLTLLVVPFAGLAVLSYYAAKLVEGAEREREVDAE